MINKMKYNDNQELLLGDVDLKKYINPTTQENADVEKVLKELKKDNLESEEYFVKELENRLIASKYNLIDLSFLEMSSKVKMNDYEFIVPRFTAYNYYGSNIFTIDIGESGIVGERLVSWPLFGEDDLGLKKNMRSMYVAAGFSVEDKSVERMYAISDKDYLVIGNRQLPQEDIGISTNFTGLISREVKENVKKSRNYFDKTKIYVIMETKPEQWNVEHITKDPLVIGIKNKHAYLIDHFNTTDLENLVKDTYTKLN